MHAEAAAKAGASESSAFGRPGAPFDRRAPFLVGFLGATGAILAAGKAWLIVAAGQVLVLIGVAFFIAARRSSRVLLGGDLHVSVHERKQQLVTARSRMPVSV
jgi:hypothetical protein